MHPDKPVFELNAEQWEAYLDLAAEGVLPRPLHIWMKPRVVHFRLPEHAVQAAEVIAPAQLADMSLSFGAGQDRPSRVHRWTQAEEARLRQLFAEGVSSTEIATKLHRKETAVRARARKRGIKVPRKRKHA